jgi:lipopolysaccharide/colanic/teichoic acid biosynthesis glycosyltransferase
MAIKLDSRGPVLYVDRRVGVGERGFGMLKFRTMVAGAAARQGELEAANEATGALFKIRDDPRVTRVGRVLRRFSLDELPQLWNVVRGDMSLVGPRPIRPRFFASLVDELPAYWQRLVVRPGLTGLAQVRRGYETSMAEKLAHDLEWIADRSVRLYLRTLTTTAWRVLGQFARGLSGRSR